MKNPIMRFLSTWDYQSLPLPAVVSNSKAAPTQSWTHISFSKHGQEITGHQLMTQQIVCWCGPKEICSFPIKNIFDFLIGLLKSQVTITNNQKNLLFHSERNHDLVFVGLCVRRCDLFPEKKVLVRLCSSYQRENMATRKKKNIIKRKL